MEKIARVIPRCVVVEFIYFSMHLVIQYNHDIYKKGLQMVIVCFPVVVSLGVDVGGTLHM